MEAKRNSIILITASTLLAVILVWLRWTYLPPPGYYSPDKAPLVLAGLFAAAILAGFGAVMPTRRFWRLSLQLISGLLLLAFVVLPVDIAWFLPKPKFHRMLIGPIPEKPREEILTTIHAKPMIEKRPSSSNDFYEVLVLTPPKGEKIQIACGESFSLGMP